MRHKKAKKGLRLILELVRFTGIRLKILPRGFMTADKIEFYTINDKKKDYAGIGGEIPRDGKMIPFIVINMAFHHNTCYVMATLAHELLHIQQAREGTEANHGNKFRADCAEFAKALGLPYYLVYSYDAPSESACIAYGKNREKWYRSFRKSSDKRGEKNYSPFADDSDMPK